jgi:glycosyltransferase involved in cell wall biosynthesis
MGLPVLAQPKSSMPEAVIDDLTGWLLPAENLNIWADKLKEINQWSTVIRHNFSSRAREFTQKNFSWDLIAKQYSDLYEAVARK